MPGTIDRKTGEIIQMPEYGKAEKERLMEAYIKAFLARHPETIQNIRKA